MADYGTMAAYAANIDRYRQMVGDTGGNPMLSGFIDRLAARSAVLDFGCGVGDSAARMQAAGHDVTCIDASPDMVMAAKELFGLDVRQQSFDDFDDVDGFHDSDDFTRPSQPSPTRHTLASLSGSL